MGEAQREDRGLYGEARSCSPAAVYYVEASLRAKCNTSAIAGGEFLAGWKAAPLLLLTFDELHLSALFERCLKSSDVIE